MTNRRLIRVTGMSALVAGLLFVTIQPIHPPDTLASVTTGQWAIVHYATLVMTVLFSVGISGIYLRQVEETGWLGLAGVIALNLALIITGMMVFVEAFISPELAGRDPEYVEALLGMVSGTAIQVDLGALPLLWSVSGVLFPLGCLVVGIAIMRARILPRWAAGVLAFGLPVAVVAVSILPGDLHRLGAVPVGVGLAWLGYALWVDLRPQPSGRTQSGSFRTYPARTEDREMQANPMMGSGLRLARRKTKDTIVVSSASPGQISSPRTWSGGEGSGVTKYRGLTTLF